VTRLSLRSRLLLAVGVVALLALVVADVTVYASLKSYLYGQVDATLQLSQQSMAGAVAAPSPPGQGQPQGAGFCAVGRESAPGMFLAVLDSSGRVVDGNECPAFTPGKKSYAPELTDVLKVLRARATGTSSGSATGTSSANAIGNGIGSSTYYTVASTDPGGPAFRVQATQVQGGDVLLVADPLSGLSKTLERLLLLELSVTGAALALSVLVGLWLVRLGLRPLRDVERTAEAITHGDLVHRVPNANNRTEMGRVAEALNVMLGRIESGFTAVQASESRLRRFVSDASHELRTPIAAVSAYAQLFEFGAAKSEKEMRRVMAGIENETARMARLVDDLLVLARFDEERSQEPELVELVGLALESVQTARLMGSDWPIEFTAGDVVEVMGDPVALRQVVDNLLKNVRAHTPQGTTTFVRVTQVDDEAVVEVEDDGPGLDDGDASHVFERFFRSDPSRSRDTGGAGLGLAIVATIVGAHAGHAEVETGSRGGALFRVVLPSAAPQPLLAEGEAEAGAGALAGGGRRD
jgi:two-component system OmpR family sensor kinase